MVRLLHRVAKANLWYNAEQGLNPALQGRLKYDIYDTAHLPQW